MSCIKQCHNLLKRNYYTLQWLSHHNQLRRYKQYYGNHCHIHHPTVILNQCCRSISTIDNSAPLRPAPQYTDTIELIGLELFGYHGYYPAERELGQKFIIDCKLITDTRLAGTSDDIIHTVHYGNVYKLIESIVSTPQNTAYNLLESLAHNIAIQILSQYNTIQQCNITIKKPHVAIHGTINYLGISIQRTRTDLLYVPAPLSTVTTHHNNIINDEHTLYQASSHINESYDNNQYKDEADRISDRWQYNIDHKSDIQRQLDELHDSDDTTYIQTNKLQSPSKHKHRSNLLKRR